MSVYYFKAYALDGEKRTGTIEADDSHAAAAKLQKTGIKPYFLHDYRAVKKAHRRRKKRRKIIMMSGAVAILVSTIASVYIVEYAGREQALNISFLVERGLLKGTSKGISGETNDHRNFAKGISDAWNGYAPNVVTGVDVSNVMMTIYVSEGVLSLSDADLKALVTNSVKTMQRRFNLGTSSLVVVKDERTIMEASYAGMSGKTTLKSF